MPAKKKGKGNGPRFVPQQRFAWVEYFDPEQPDNPPMRCRVRADLSFGEANTLTFDKDGKTPMPEVWEKLAPFVVDWNLDDIDGNPIPAPAEAGGMQFDYVPMSIFWKIWNDLKWRSSGTVESKRLSGAASSPETAGAASSETPA